MANDDYLARIVFDVDQAIKAIDKVANSLTNLRDEATDAGVSIDRSLGKTGDGARKAAAGQKELKKSSESATGSIISQRYALYDLATTYTAVSASITALGVLSVKAFADQEYAFANFRRTLDPSSTVEQINTLRASFRQMSTEIPVAFGELSKIGSIGNQLGIAREDVVKFTDTVVKSSVAMGLSVDEVALAYGQLGNLLDVPASQFRNLGSAIALVGVNSEATEQQIISVAREIGATAAQAGFTADEVVGLAGAISSLKIAPERARGSLDTYFATLNRAVAKGGQDLKDFATIVGVSSAELEKMVRNGQAVDIFQGFLKGLADLDNVDATAALGRLNLSQLRVSNSLIRLAQSQDLVNRTLRDGEQGYKEATELDRQYGEMVDTTTSQMQIFGNAVENLAASFGEAFAPALGAVLSALTPLLVTITQFIETPVGGFIATVVAGAMALTAAMAAVRGATAFAQASLLALELVTAKYTVTQVSATGAVRSFGTAIMGQTIPALFGLNAQMKASVAWSRTLKAALASIPILAAAEFVFLLGDNLLYAVNQAERMNEVVRQAKEDVSSFQSALNSLNNALEGSSRKTGLEGMFGAEESVEGLVDRFNEAFDALEERAKALGTSMEAAFKIGAGTGLADTVAEFEAMQQIGDAARDAGMGLSEFAQQSTDASQAIRDIPEVFFEIDRAIGELAAGGDLEGANNLILALSDVTGRSVAELSALLPILRSVSAEFAAFSQYQSAVGDMPAILGRMKAAAERSGRAVGGAARQVRTLVDYASDLRKVLDRSFEIRFGSRLAMDEYISSWRAIGREIDEYRRKVQSLTARRDLEQYFLSIAEAYGDTFQAGNLRASIADLNAEISEASAKASTSLKGSSDAAIENRKRITGLLKDYHDYIEALAASGASQSTIKKAVASSRADFIAQAKALGYSESELKEYVKQFDSMTTTINKVPRNITVTANANPAIQALNELAAKSASAGSKAGSSFNKAFSKEMKKFQEASTLWAQYQSLLASYAANSGNYNAQTQIAKELKKLQDRLNKLTKGFAGGGYTGNGGKYEGAGLVHKGEFVMNAEATRNIGVGNLYTMMRAAQNGRGYAAGGYVAPTPVPVQSGSGVVTINPQQMNQLVAAVSRQVGVIFSNDPRSQSEIAKMSNAGNQVLGKRGQR